MSVFVFLPFIALVFNTFSLGYTYTLKKKNDVLKGYFSFVLFLEIWTLSYILTFMDIQIDVLFILKRLQLMLGCFVGSAYLYFSYSWVNKKRGAVFYSSIACWAVVAILICCTDYIVSGVYINDWGTSYITGDFFYAVFICIIPQFVIAFALIYKHMGSIENDYFRKKLKIVLYGSTFIFLTVSATIFYFKVTYTAHIPELAPMLVSLQTFLGLLVIKAHDYIPINSDKLFYDLFFNLDMGIVILDKYNAVVNVNKEAEKLLGIRSYQALGKNIEKLLPGYDVNQGECEFAMKMKEGGKYYFAKQTFLNRASIESARLVLITDITDTKFLEKQLELHKKRYFNFFESPSYMMHILDEKGNIIDVNSCWIKTLGYSNKQEVYGHPISDYFAEETGESSFEKISCQKMIKKDKELLDVIVRPISINDKDFFISASIIIPVLNQRN